MIHTIKKHLAGLGVICLIVLFSCSKKADPPIDLSQTSLSVTVDVDTLICKQILVLNILGSENSLNEISEYGVYYSYDQEDPRLNGTRLAWDDPISGNSYSKNIVLDDEFIVRRIRVIPFVKYGSEERLGQNEIEHYNAFTEVSSYTLRDVRCQDDMVDVLFDLSFTCPETLALTGCVGTCLALGSFSEHIVNGSYSVPLPQSRIFMGIKAIVSGKEFIVRDDELWAVQENRWFESVGVLKATQQADFIGPLRGEGVSFTIGNTMYVGGGYDVDRKNALRDFYAYNIQSQQWSILADLPEAIALGVGFSMGGRGYVGTGSTDLEIPSDKFWEYDPQTNSWQPFTSIPVAQMAGISFVSNDTAYVGLGVIEDSKGENTDRLWKISPNESQWREICCFPNSINASRNSAFVIDNKGYVIIHDESFSFPNFFSLNLMTGEWSIEEDYPYDFDDGVALSHQGFGYVISGRNNFFVQKFDPLTDTWTQWCTSEFMSRSEGVAAVVENQILLATGVQSNLRASEPTPGITSTFSIELD